MSAGREGATRLRPLLTDIGAFSRLVAPDRALRPYQLVVAEAIVRSVLRGEGEQFAVVFSRQAGKDELLAQLVAFLLSRQRRAGGSIVVAAPTFRPQAAVSRDRLLARLRHPLLEPYSRVREGYVVELGEASARFLSSGPGSNPRGQTADLLLVANEAQDIPPDRWDAVFDPMAAATNATTLFMGTTWSRDTLLARQMRHLARLEGMDGRQRVFRVGWEEVAAVVPAYGDRVRSRIAQFGADHPWIRTEYLLEELDGEGSLFPPHRLAQMAGDHPRIHRPEPGRRYALLIDVAGGEEAGGLASAFQPGARRDSTAVTVVEIGEGAGRPVYRVVDRMAWTGESPAALHARLVDLARTVWRVAAVVIDATGIGAGVASHLAAALGQRGDGGGAVAVIPYVFTAASKSALGWNFLALIDSGRFKEYRDDRQVGGPAAQLTGHYYAQLAATRYETGIGPGHGMRWSVPAGAGHDDLVVSAALVAALDGHDWRPRVAMGTHGREFDGYRNDE